MIRRIWNTIWQFCDSHDVKIFQPCKIRFFQGVSSQICIKNAGNPVFVSLNSLVPLGNVQNVCKRRFFEKEHPKMTLQWKNADMWFLSKKVVFLKYQPVFKLHCKWQKWGNNVPIVQFYCKCIPFCRKTHLVGKLNILVSL